MSVLSEKSLERIAREVAKYPADQRQSAVMGALAIAQDQHGWLSDEAIEAVAGVLGMPPVAVYEVATFYNMYNLKPAGRHKVTVCTNLPCALSGGVDAAEHLQRRLGVGFGGTTADGCINPPGRRVHGRLRGRAGAPGGQQAHVQLHVGRQARRPGRGAEEMTLLDYGPDAVIMKAWTAPTGA